MKTLVAIGAAVLLGITSHPARAACPIGPDGKCVKPSVSYTFRESGYDQAGNQYWRICHVPLHHRSWCGPWHPDA